MILLKRPLLIYANPTNLLAVNINNINPVIMMVITIVKSPLNNLIQLVAAESPSSPSISVTIESIITINNGCTCNRSIVKLITLFDDADKKNNIIHINDKINE